MDKKQLDKLRKKYSLKNFLSEDDYNKAKERYINVKVKAEVAIEDVKLGPREYYNRITSLKKANTEIEYTDDMINEYIKCKNDPVYFINAYVKIVHVDFGLVPFNLRAFQEDIVQVCSEFNKVILNTSRQVGKCVDGNTKISVIKPKNNIFAKMLYPKLMKLKTWAINREAAKT